MMLSSDARVRYALAILLDTPAAADWPDWLAYGRPEELAGRRGVCIVPSGFFGADYGAQRSLPTLPLPLVEGIPLLYGEPLVRREGDVLVVRADILASAYFLVTRYEEWIRKEVRDDHGRFPGKESLPYRADFLERPIVEQYGELLRRWALEAGIPLPQPQRRFSVLLTHDVDSIGMKLPLFQPLRSLASALLGRQSFRQALRTSAVAWRLADDPWDNIADVVRMDARLLRRAATEQCGAIYFFLAEKGSPLDGNYSIRGRQARRALDCVLASGAEVGLHASYEAGQKPELIAGQRAALQQVVGTRIHKNRHHYLAWREPADGQAIAAAGIDWDSTLGYVDVAGFRLGVCHPIPLFDPARRCLLGIEEHPLIVMDGSLSHPKYMGLDEEAAMACACRLAEATYRYRGEFVILWHNTLLGPAETSFHPRLYLRVLDYLARLLQCASSPPGLEPHQAAPGSELFTGARE